MRHEEIFEIVSVIKKRHDEGAIRRCSDHTMLDQDIKRVDDIYLWFVRLKEEGIRLTKSSFRLDPVPPQQSSIG